MVEPGVGAVVEFPALAAAVGGVGILARKWDGGVVLPLRDEHGRGNRGVGNVLFGAVPQGPTDLATVPDRKSTRLNSSHVAIPYALFCLHRMNQRQMIFVFAS